MGSTDGLLDGGTIIRAAWRQPGVGKRVPGMTVHLGPDGLFAAWEGPSHSSEPPLIRTLLGDRDSPEHDRHPNTRRGSQQSFIGPQTAEAPSLEARSSKS